MTRLCAHCNGPLGRHQTKYCSVEHRYLALRSTQTVRNCNVCGKVLRSDQKSACSQVCRLTLQQGYKLYQPQKTLDRITELWGVIPQISIREIGQMLDPVLSRSQVARIRHALNLPAREQPCERPAGMPRAAPKPRAQRPPTGPTLRPKGPSPSRPVVQRVPPPGRDREASAAVPRPRPPAADGGPVCTWPTSNGKPWTFCGCPVTSRTVWTSEGKADKRWSSWCEEHHRIVYQRGTAVAA